MQTQEMKTNRIRARFDRGVFVPERKPRIADGQVVYLAVSLVSERAKEENPSPSGDPYFLDSGNVRGVLDSAGEMWRGEGKAFTLEQLDAIMGL